MPHESGNFFEFGEFRFDPKRRVLWRGVEMIPLSPKAVDVLAMLVAERGNLVERQALIDRVWSGTFVEEGNLNHAVSALRKVLGNDSIQTVPRRGYRFTAEVIERRPDVASEIVVQKRTISNTLIAEQEEFDDRIPLVPMIKGRSARPTYLAPVAGLLMVLLAAGAAWFLFGARSKADARSSIHTLAVLPLKSFSAVGDDEELRLRLTDALITTLGRNDTLVVRPTNSVIRFAEDKDAVAVGKALSVDAVLDGRVQEEGSRLRVTLQLVAVATGEQLWSEQFDGHVGEILALQDSIASRLQGDLALGNGQRQGRSPAINSESYEAYLKGRYLWNQRRKASYYKALDYFQKSVELDPDFALGYTGIADTYHLLQQRNVLPVKEAFEIAEPAAKRAFELDPNLPETNTSMGVVSHIRYGRFGEAETYFRRAIQLNPNLAEPYARLGMLYNSWGRFDEAHEVLTKAVELDPTSVNNAVYLGAHYYFSKQYDRAAEQFNRVLEFAPGTERAHFFLTRIYELNGRYDEAVDQALKERAIYRPESVEPLRQAYATGGIRAFWMKQIELLQEELKEMYGLENHIASRYILLGDLERACDFAEINLKNFGAMQNYGLVDPLFEPLRKYPRYMHAMKEAAPQY
ncbi:MAG TPA: tetratricopeptide repeat protein [Pyrinomonadaceae bacterium]|nr:tetratricopeptide repeat protein [Pyrinomonadaceae bacterium]